eukprot:jgi/Mesen1/6410/ME000329S05576
MFIGLLTIFGALCEYLGGASFNPAGNICNYCAGVGNDSVLSMGVRIPAQVPPNYISLLYSVHVYAFRKIMLVWKGDLEGAQQMSWISNPQHVSNKAVGSALGAYAIWIAMPDQLKHSLTRARLAPGVDMYEGAFVEFALTLFINLLALYSMFGGVRSALVRTFLLIAGSVIVGALGGPYSGPSLNPANAFGWAYVEKSHNTTEHIYTFWTAPIVGTILAGIAFKVLLKPKEEKVKVKAS